MDFSPATLAAATAMPLLLAILSRSLAARKPSFWWSGCLFALGAASMLPQARVASMIEAWTQGITNPYLVGLWESFLLAALPEELNRFLLLLLAVALVRRADDPMRSMAYGGLISAGFAWAEAVLGALGNDGLLRVAIGRSLGAIGHCCDGVIMGYFVGLALARPGRRALNLALALAVPMLLHTLFDLGILTEVPGDADTPADEMPPWPALALMAATTLTWFGSLTWTIVLIRKSRKMRSSVPR